MLSYQGCHEEVRVSPRKVAGIQEGNALWETISLLGEARVREVMANYIQEERRKVSAVLNDSSPGAGRRPLLGLSRGWVFVKLLHCIERGGDQDLLWNWQSLVPEVLDCDTRL